MSSEDELTEQDRILKLMTDDELASLLLKLVKHHHHIDPTFRAAIRSAALRLARTKAGPLEP